MDPQSSAHAAALWTGLHLILLLVLSVLVTRQRRKHHIEIGDGGVPALNQAIRAFGNAAEYVPAALIGLGVLALAGAMPPALGWAAIANDVPMQAWVLVMIIFIWTPPHFWALAMYRRDDYAKSGLPMLPITHGMDVTKLHILMYTIALFAVSLLPFAIGMSGLIYLATAVVLGAIFFWYSWQIYRRYTDLIARKAFAYSIVYLSILFAVLLVDHYFLFRGF
jgi:protoheme IX farnesyltransferase